MASINQWVSILKPSAEPADMSLTLASQNLDPEVAITVTVSIPANSAVTTIAKLLTKAINVKLGTEEKLYAGAPSFEDSNPPTFRLRARQVGHLIDIWAQTEFEIRSVTAPKGAFVHIGSTPVYATFDDMEKYAVAVGATFQTVSGECLSDQQRLGALVSGSGELISAADGFFIVAAQYLHEETRSFFKGWNFEHYPVIAFDHPHFRGDNGNYFDYAGGYQVNTSDGTVTLLLQSSPLLMRTSRVQYDLKHSYVAGLSQVHETLKIETVRFASISMWPSHISKVKRGSGSIEMTSLGDVRSDFKNKLARLIG